MKSAFWDNTANYLKTTLTEKEVKRIYKTTFCEGWNSLSKFKQGSIPYPYIMRKKKAVSRVRPMSPSSDTL